MTPQQLANLCERHRGQALPPATTAECSACKGIAPVVNFFPAPDDLRQAAKVLRWVTRQYENNIQELPRLQRWWVTLTRGNPAPESLRKAGLLEEFADEMEAEGDNEH